MPGVRAPGLPNRNLLPIMELRGLLPSLVRSVVYPLHERLLKRGTMRFARELEWSQWSAPDDIRELQNAKLTALLMHAWRNVPFYRARLLVKPGITGWAQVNYGYSATIAETIVKLEYDLYYIKHRNMWTDMLILFRTFTQIFTLQGR